MSDPSIRNIVSQIEVKNLELQKVFAEMTDLKNKLDKFWNENTLKEYSKKSELFLKIGHENEVLLTKYCLLMKAQINVN